MRGRNVGGNTIGKEIETFRAAWNWGVDAGKLKGEFPKKGLRLPKQIEMRTFQTWEEIERQIEKGNLSESEQADHWDCLFLTLNEIDELLKHVKETARQPFIYPMFVMAAHTGARRSELLRCQVTDFNCDTVTIRERKRVRGKQSTRRVPLSIELRQVMDQWFANHPGGAFTFSQVDVVRSKKHGKCPRPVTRDEAHDHFKRPLAGSKWGKVKGWHCFRHSFCSNCAMKGIDQRIIDAWVGHTTEDMRRRYRHLFPNSEKQAMS
ncbi:MAG: site-specific integrase, partial [Planctomycetia bacterium]|nr:site-specific integrase [Planctomycetia bacterium]